MGPKRGKFHENDDVHMLIKIYARVNECSLKDRYSVLRAKLVKVAAPLTMRLAAKTKT